MIAWSTVSNADLRSNRTSTVPDLLSNRAVLFDYALYKCQCIIIISSIIINEELLELCNCLTCW